MITNKFVVPSLWPVNGISVTSLFGGKLQVSDDSKIKMTSKSIIMEFSIQVSPM
jgi:hypothetical protein